MRPAVHPKDDIVGWPDELLIDFPDFPDFTIDSVANTPTPEPALYPYLFKTTNLPIDRTNHRYLNSLIGS